MTASVDSLASPHPAGVGPVLLTGASGKLGREVATRLFAQGWRLRLTDLVPFPDDIPDGSTFEAADLNDGAALRRLAQGCRAIVHFGGLVEYGSFEAVLGPNMRGTYNVFEAARAAGARVVYASSNHVVGYHERPDHRQGRERPAVAQQPGSERLDADCTLRPDSWYGLSKAVGELMARLYWDRNGVESVSMRIGSCFAEPADARMLATWLSRDDLTRLVVRSVEAPRTGCAIVWGVSRNAVNWWGADDRARIGWTPQDSADAWAGRVQAKGDALAQRFQGGGFCAVDYTLETPGHRRA